MHKRETAEFTLEFGKTVFSFLRPKNSEALLNEITEEEFLEDEFLPYWAELWPSSFNAIEYLPTVVSKSQPILEIGAGLGVVSTVLATQGYSLFASDYSNESCEFMQLNGQRNSVSFHVFCSDWRYPSVRKLFDTIIGIDILYEERWIAPVLLHIENNLSEHGSAYIYDPHRSFRHAFVASLKSHPTLMLYKHHDSPSSSGKSIIDCYEIRRSAYEL